MFLAATPNPTAGAHERRARSTASFARVSLAALLALALVPAAHAQNNHWTPDGPQIWRGLETWAEGKVVDVQVRVDGQASPLYFAPGRNDRRYFQAFTGRNYSLVVRNNTGRRVAVLIAVDGLNVVSGEISRLRPDEQMYVLAPWQTTTIRGWRTNLDEVRRFVFVDERRSYAERTGQSNRDMGWIRVLSFREQQPLAWGGGTRYKSNYRESGPSAQELQDSKKQVGPQANEQAAPPPATSPAPQANGKAVAPEASDNMARNESDSAFPGTGWGDRRQDPVRRVQFDAERWATDHLIFRYEYASGLRAVGILPVHFNGRDRLADRDSDVGFAQAPRR
jgi:hypothetical protein